MPYGLLEIATLLGALGLFLYGMRVMSGALLELAGERMRSLLATTTATPLLAVLTGLGITAVIQSSSATTLMVVSFANAGLLTLREAIGVIMGTNIGTTVTAWLISILGFKFSLNDLALPLVGIGFLLTLRKDKLWQQWGYFLIGFAVLFIGLEFLKGSVPDLQTNPQLLDFLTGYTRFGFASVLLFLAGGALLTVVVQSSSAAMALTLLMTWEGWIPFDMAVAMVLGQNIGTTATANVVGVLVALLLFYPSLDWIDAVMRLTAGTSPGTDRSAVPLALALYHTGFNIANTLLLIGLIERLAALVSRLLPEPAPAESAIEQPVYLTPAALNYRQTGLKALFDESLRLLQHATYQAIAHGLNVHREDLASSAHLRELLSRNEPIPVNIDELYQRRIKTIYGAIVDFATRLQSSVELEEEDVESIRNILIADRMLVRTVKRMQPLHDNIVLFMTAGNEDIMREYNILRRRILKVMREIHRASESDYPLRHIRKLESQREKARQLDVLTTGRINRLLLEGRITQVMATSLLNDSEQASKIAANLIDAATLLYFPRDRLVNAMEESAVVRT
jgi:phosphate:Na+ symporter